MHQMMPLKILLADTDYSQYLSLKQMLSVKNGFRAKILWCGERDQYRCAILAGIYDLVLMDYSIESLFVLEQVITEGCHTPVVMLAENPDSVITRAVKCGALGVLDRARPERNTLKHYLLYANLYRNGELAEHLTSGFSEHLPKKYSQSVLTFLR